MKLCWPGFKEKGTLIIPVDISFLPVSKSAVTIFGKVFEPKKELHITLVGSKLGKKLQDKISYNPEIETDLKQEFELIDWTYKPSENALVLSRIKKKEEWGSDIEQKSIIVTLNMPGFAEFYEFMKSRKYIPNDTAYPPPHVTLYTLNCPHGMGIPDVEVLKRLKYQEIAMVQITNLMG